MMANEEVSMKNILDIIISLIFIFCITSMTNKITYDFKRVSLLKIHKGLSSLSSFTKKLTRK